MENLDPGKRTMRWSGNTHHQWCRRIDMKNRSIGLVTLLLFTTASCVHVGQRLLTIQIELDGQVAFEGIRGVPDNMPVEQMWDVLDDVSFKSVDTETTSRLSDQKARSLEGRVVVRIKHVDRELANTSLTSLTLAKDTTGGSWLLPADEVKRIKQAAKK
jgi:hypothetical protein